MKLAIVIVHYNTSGDLDRCLESLATYGPTCEHQVVIVDNASQDAGLTAVQQRFPDHRWIFNTENSGYSRGVNLGLASVDADYYLILNPDIVVQPGAVDRLLGFADASPKAGIVGPQLLNDDGSLQESCRRFYTFGTLLLRRTFLGKLFPNSRTVDRHLMRDFDHQSPRAVDWVLGGCILVRREAIQRTGPMDERFFLYFEDVDWCYRMWQAGWEVLYSPDARFQHRHRRDSAKGALSRSFWLHLASLISFYEKWGLLVYLLKKWRGPLVVMLLWFLDMAALATAFLGAYGLRALGGRYFPEPLYPLSEYSPMLLFTGLLATLTFLLSGRYRSSRHRRRTPALVHWQQIGTVALLVLASSYLGHQEVISRAVLLMFVVLLAVMTSLGEELFMALRRRMERGYLSLERSLLVGAPAVIQSWLDQARDLHLMGIDVVGYVAPEPAGDTPLPPLGGGEIPWCGWWTDLPQVVQRYRVSQVVFWDQPRLTATHYQILAWLRRRRIHLRWRIDEAWLLAAGARAEMFGGQASGVLEPDLGAVWSAFGLRLLSVLGGACLALVGVLPWLWLKIWALPRQRAHAVALVCRSSWGDPVTLNVVCSPDGSLLPLWCQLALSAPLLSGRLQVYGSRLAPADEPVADPQPAAAVAFWRGAVQRPGLTGRWACEQPGCADDATGAAYGFDSGYGPGAEPVAPRSRFPLATTLRILTGIIGRLVLDPGGFVKIPISATAVTAGDRSDPDEEDDS